VDGAVVRVERRVIDTEPHRESGGGLGAATEQELETREQNTQGDHSPTRVSSVHRATPARKGVPTGHLSALRFSFGVQNVVAENQTQQVPACLIFSVEEALRAAGSSLRKERDPLPGRTLQNVGVVPHSPV
jgi:hypothetical protein